MNDLLFHSSNKTNINILFEKLRQLKMELNVEDNLANVEDNLASFLGLLITMIDGNIIESS